ncbi:MAG: hypothetical protein KAJ32_01805 [Gammaproteobacteria bacterium]|nr:hypothetical protein [Gammaproteobacteria bacterium]
MTDPYDPIACSLHDEYEIAIMLKKHLTIKWLDDNGEYYKDKVLPKDILVKDKEEFLVASTHGEKDLRIRLDRITLIE